MRKSEIRTSLAILFFCQAVLSAQTTCETLAPARHELYAARYDRAAELYREALKTDPHCASAYDGLVRALLRSHRADEAYETGAVALTQAPGKAESLAAQGRALYRKGEIQQAEQAWLAALAIDPKNSSALAGLARIRSLLAEYKVAQTYIGLAHRLSPDDPGLIVAAADALHGPEQIAALQSALAIYDPNSREAKSLRARISSETAVGDIKIAKLISGYHPYEMKLMELHDGPKRVRGLALRVSFNGGGAATLMLDTGAFGIALAPRLAEKFGLRQVGSEARAVSGVGSGAMRSSFALSWLRSRAACVMQALAVALETSSLPRPNYQLFYGVLLAMLWNLLILIFFFTAASAAFESAKGAGLGFGLRTLPVAIGLVIGGACAWAMWRVGESVANSATNSASGPRQRWYIRALYASSIFWILLAAVLGRWAASELLRIVI